jgi:L-lactate dehydrogenase complex protein LldG
MTDLIDLFVANAERNGLIVHRGTVPEIPNAVRSTALFGLADPGSVVFAASREEPRARSLLPDVHIGVLEESRVLPDLSALLARLGDRLPSSLAIVSGPSRSADIEQVLALGVHGPREQHVALVSLPGV